LFDRFLAGHRTFWRRVVPKPPWVNAKASESNAIYKLTPSGFERPSHPKVVSPGRCVRIKDWQGPSFLNSALIRVKDQGAFARNLSFPWTGLGAKSFRTVLSPCFTGPKGSDFVSRGKYATYRRKKGGIIKFFDFVLFVFAYFCSNIFSIA
jgi:hypothetical protein